MFTRFDTAIVQSCLICLMAVFVSCGKKLGTTQTEKQASKAIAHVYKLGEPRPIVLNVDKPLIVLAASPTPKPTPKH